MSGGLSAGLQLLGAGTEEVQITDRPTGFFGRFRYLVRCHKMFRAYEAQEPVDHGGHPYFVMQIARDFRDGSTTYTLRKADR